MVDVSRAVMGCSRFMGVGLPEEGNVGVIYDGSIIQDTASEKRQEMAEVAARLMKREEYRSRWYGEPPAATFGSLGARRPVARKARRRSRKESFSPYSEPPASEAEHSLFSPSSPSFVEMALIWPSHMSRASASLKAKSRSSS